MAGGSQQRPGGTLDSFNIFRSGQLRCIIADMGKKTLHFELFRKSLFALAAAETGNFAVFAFFRSFFRGVAIDMHRTVSRNQFDHAPGTCRNTVAATYTEFRMDQCQIVDDLDRSERTLRGTAAHADTTVTAAFGTSDNQTCRSTVQHTVVIDGPGDLMFVSAATDNGTLFESLSGSDTESKRNSRDLLLA